MSAHRRLLAALVTALAVLAALLAVPAQGATNGTISGNVTVPGGQPAGDGYVLAYQADDLIAYPATRNVFGGSYSFSLPPGDYLLYFRPQTVDEVIYAPQWWAGSPTREGATPITVMSGEVVTADTELAPAGSISGHVATNHPTLGYLDTEVVAWQRDESYPGGWAKHGPRSTDEDGNYRFLSLPAGEYRLYFYSQLTHYEGYWPNATTLESATSINLAEGETLTDKDPELTPAGTISGKVIVASTSKPVGGVRVQMYHDFGQGFVEARGQWWGDTTTAADGTYTLVAPADDYKIRFTPPTSTRLRPEYWNNSIKLFSATPVTLTTGVATANIHGRLERNLFKVTSAAAITGTLRVGQYLKAVPPKTYPGATTKTYQWLRNGKPISGAAAKRSYYKLTLASRGTKIGVKITLSRAGYYPVVRTVTRRFTVQ